MRIRALDTPRRPLYTQNTEISMFPKKKTPKGTPPAFRQEKGEKDEDRGGAVVPDLSRPGETLPSWPGASKPGGRSPSIPFLGGGTGSQGSLAQKLKSLKPKDLAFIAAGLAVLVMVPLAEFMISSPEEEAGTLRQGFDQKGPMFPDGSAPYEDGLQGIAPGGLVGQGSDVVTPLNVRDPTALIMSPGSAAPQKPALSETPPARQPPKDEADWRSALPNAAGRGARAGARAAPKLPKPNAKLAGALADWRSVLSGAKGGGGPSFKLEAPNSKGLFSSPAAGTNIVRTQAIPGFRGGGRSMAGGGFGPGLFGDGRFGPGPTPNSGAADTWAGGISMGGGGFGDAGGRPSTGDGRKNPGGNSTNDQKSLGESLAFLRAKMEMEKAVDLKWAKRKYDELERKKMLEQIAAQTASQAALKVLDSLLKMLEEAAKGGKGDGGGGDPAGGGDTAGGGNTDPGRGGGDPNANPDPPNTNPDSVNLPDPVNVALISADAGGEIPTNAFAALEKAETARTAVNGQFADESAIRRGRGYLQELRTLVGRLQEENSGVDEAARAAGSLSSELDRAIQAIDGAIAAHSNDHFQGTLTSIRTTGERLDDQVKRVENLEVGQPVPDLDAITVDIREVAPSADTIATAGNAKIRQLNEVSARIVSAVAELPQQMRQNSELLQSVRATNEALAQAGEGLRTAGEKSVEVSRSLAGARTLLTNLQAPYNALRTEVNGLEGNFTADQRTGLQPEITAVRTPLGTRPST